MAHKQWLPEPVDRSKYRNPDMPVGYVKKQPKLVYKEGKEYDGVYSRWAGYILEENLEECPDYDTLHIWIPCDEDCAIEAEVPGKSDCASPIKIKKEKDDDDDDDNTKSVQKGHDKNDTLDASFSQINIDAEEKKKKKKSKKSHKSGYKSDESSSSSVKHHKHRSPARQSPSSSSKRDKKIVTYSPSPSPSPSPPDQNLDVKVKMEFPFMPALIKQESFDGTQHLFGCYHCEVCNSTMNSLLIYNTHINGKRHRKVCNITMNSLLTYNTHINGKRHRKNLKVKNVSEAVAQCIPATAVSEDQSKYPKPMANVIRRRVQEPAEIQHVIEKNVTVPCPGLDHVIEIRGIGSIQYYCSMCDAVCASNSIIAHLTGFKHQLRSVKQFKPGLYEKIQDEPKYKIDKQIRDILRAVQKKDGMGRMAVEVDELISVSNATSQYLSSASTSRDYRDIPSTSRDYSRDAPSTSHDYRDHSSRGTYKNPDMSFNELYNRTSIPSMDASDFYCDICQSHMNSVQMWDAHIRGKRHLANLKKNPGELPSKTKTVAVKRKAILLKRIKNECPDEPFVGLKEVRETEIPETGSESYQCFLCGSCHTSLDILDHLISLKHRTKYLDHIDYSGREIIAGMSESAAQSIVRDMCYEVEANEGSGEPEVHVSKSALVYR